MKVDTVIIKFLSLKVRAKEGNGGQNVKIVKHTMFNDLPCNFMWNNLDFILVSKIFPQMRRKLVMKASLYICYLFLPLVLNKLVIGDLNYKDLKRQM